MSMWEVGDVIWVYCNPIHMVDRSACPIFEAEVLEKKTVSHEHEDKTGTIDTSYCVDAGLSSLWCNDDKVFSCEENAKIYASRDIMDTLAKRKALDDDLLKALHTMEPLTPL